MRSLIDSLAAALRPEAAPRNGASWLLCGEFMTLARAWRFGRVEPWFVLTSLLRVPEVEQTLAARGVERRDLDAVTSQLVDELEASEAEPVVAPEVERAFQASQRGGRPDFATFVRGIGEALPPPYAFARAAVAGSAEAVAAALDRPLSHDAKGNLTLEGWSPNARTTIASAQVLADRSGGSFFVEPEIVLLAAVVLPDVAPVLARRGLTYDAVLAELAARKAAREADEGLDERRRRPRKKARDEPARVGLRFHALLVRAERLAAEDRSDVTLGHLLAALRAHDFTRAVIDRMDL